MLASRLAPLVTLWAFIFSGPIDFRLFSIFGAVLGGNQLSTFNRFLGLFSAFRLLFCGGIYESIFRANIIDFRLKLLG